MGRRVGQPQVSSIQGNVIAKRDARHASVIGVAHLVTKAVFAKYNGAPITVLEGEVGYRIKRHDEEEEEKM
jgi:hypothetical protein